MIHVKIHCDDCAQDYDLTCEGIYFCMKNPSDKPGEGFLNGLSHVSSLEILPAILRFLLPDILQGAHETMENVNFREWLKSMGVNLE